MPPVFGPLSPSSRRLWSCAGGKRDHALAVGEHEQRQLFALHEFFDEHGVAGVAERALLEHRGRRVVGFVDACAQMITPFPGGEPRRLDDHRRAQRGDRALRVLQRVAGEGARRRNAGVDHEQFRKRLRRLEHRAGGGRAEDRQSGRRGTRRRCRPPAAPRVRSASSRSPRVSANSRNRSMSSAPIGTHVASSAMPGLPGAAKISAFGSSCRRRQASACSRPPPPTSNTFIDCATPS